LGWVWARGAGGGGGGGGGGAAAGSTKKLHHRRGLGELLGREERNHDDGQQDDGMDGDGDGEGVALPRPMLLDVGFDQILEKPLLRH